MNDVIVVILSLVWIPTVWGLIRSWRRYWRVRHYGDQWLIQLIAIIATLATPIVMYISLASANRWLGNAPFENGVLWGTVVAFIAAFIVPVIEIRFELWSRGKLADPVVPEPVKPKDEQHG